jgi:hypothetical protein
MPIVDAIFNLASVLEHFGEQLSQEIVIRGFLKTEFPNVVKINPKFLWIANQ